MKPRKFNTTKIFTQIIFNVKFPDLRYVLLGSKLNNDIHRTYG